MPRHHGPRAAVAVIHGGADGPGQAGRCERAGTGYDSAVAVSRRGQPALIGPKPGAYVCRALGVELDRLHRWAKPARLPLGPNRLTRRADRRAPSVRLRLAGLGGQQLVRYNEAPSPVSLQRNAAQPVAHVGGSASAAAHLRVQLECVVVLLSVVPAAGHSAADSYPGLNPMIDARCQPASIARIVGGLHARARVAPVCAPVCMRAHVGGDRGAGGLAKQRTEHTPCREWRRCSWSSSTPRPASAPCQLKAQPAPIRPRIMCALRHSANAARCVAAAAAANALSSRV